MKANAKVNLSLRVLCRRADGYHELDTLMQSVSLHDSLHIARAKKTCVKFLGLDVPEDNTVTRAVRAYEVRAGVPCPVRVRVTKNIPEQAGLGGGSADAAAVLKALQKLYPALNDAALAEAAREVGADVPFCLQGGLCRATGTGERLECLENVDNFWLVLVKPSQGVPTGPLFSALDAENAGKMLNSTAENVDCAQKKAICAMHTGDWQTFSTYALNDLQPVAVAREPEIAACLTLLKREGAVLARMTGSGSCVFGLFEKRREAARAARHMKRNTDYFVALVRPVKE